MRKNRHWLRAFYPATPPKAVVYRLAIILLLEFLDKQGQGA
jgi:hypothetical protein